MTHGVSMQLLWMSKCSIIQYAMSRHACKNKKLSGLDQNQNVLDISTFGTFPRNWKKMEEHKVTRKKKIQATWIFNVMKKCARFLFYKEVVKKVVLDGP